MEHDQIHCPRCNSVQLTANQKGFSGGKAVAGVLLTGGIGLLAGTIGSKKVTITCLSCGKQFKPGEGKPATTSQPKLIWDEQQKKHVVNPKYSGSVQTVSLAGFLVAVGIILLVLYLIFK